ncbi:MAG: hypothetical protein NZ927_07230 [Candidatus Calescibacterium sp.]|nr:hypothetical protein [Candidatus Calescibacterium sp.]MCX7734972.1 hypothetical protein [bacterium]MDW8087908.1 hypothetical protein [Candidatus Calescibacterium sp.]
MGILRTINQVFNYTNSISKILRYPKIYVSEISDSLYCEWRKVLELNYGKVRTKEMREGTKIHKEFLSFNISDIDEAEIQIQSGRSVSFPAKVGFIHKEKKLMVSGQVDSAFFYQDRVVKILEFKTRKNPKIYESDILQAGIYALSFEEMIGKELDDLEIQIVVGQRVDRGSRKHNGSAYSSKVEINISESYRFKEIKKYVSKKLDYILDFWSGRREPNVAFSKDICNNCHFYRICNRKIL